MAHYESFSSKRSSHSGPSSGPSGTYLRASLLREAPIVGVAAGVFRLGCSVGGAGVWFRKRLIGLSWWLIVNQHLLR